jgi:membrane protease YdiL (CAAX protease family)
MTRTIFSSAPHRGWLPWTWASPIVCILLVALSSVPFDSALTWLGFTDAKGKPLSTFGFCVMLVTPFVAMGATVWAWSRFIERRDVTTLGLIGAHPLRKHVAGMAAGVGMMAVAVAAIWLAGGYVSRDFCPALSSPTSLSWMAVLLACFVVQSGVEEFIFRGWLLSAATRRSNLTAGFIASSIAFTFLHFSPRASAQDIILTFVFGLFACAWAWRAGSIWGVMGWHAGWNWFAGVGFALPITGLDVQLPALVVRLLPVGPVILTGGPSGPESSILTIGILTAGTLFLLFLPGRSLGAHVAAEPATGSVAADD